MRARFFRLWAVLALVLCISAASAKSASAATAQKKGIDAALLAKANAGDAEAQYQLGNMYNFGDGVRRDYAQALVWYRKGAEQGDAESEFQLGGLYHFGHGVPQDDAQGFAWIMKAAEQGHTDAEFFISTCYGEGWGVAKDDAQGIVWLRKGSGAGTLQFTIISSVGRMRPAIDGVSQDYAEAYFWLDLAASESDSRKERKEAVKKRDKAASHLTAAELSSEQERVRQWLQDHPAQPQLKMLDQSNASESLQQFRERCSESRGDFAEGTQPRLAGSALQVGDVDLVDAGLLGKVDLSPAFGPAQLPDALARRRTDVLCHASMIGLAFALYLAHTLFGAVSRTCALRQEVQRGSGISEETR